MSVVHLSELTAAPEGAERHLSGKCEEHGEYTVEAFYLSGVLRNPDPDCPQCVIAESKREAQAEYHQGQMCRIDAMVNDSGIEAKMADCRINNYQAIHAKAKHNRDVCQQYIESWLENAGGQPNIIMIGRVGNGKTHLGCAVAIAAMRRYQSRAIYTRADDMASYIRDSYNSSSGYTESAALKRFGEVPLLVLDELGNTEAKDHERTLLSRVTDKRYLKKLPTIVMSNFTVTELKARTDERMISRLLENSHVLVFDWDDYRAGGQA